MDLPVGLRRIATVVRDALLAGGLFAVAATGVAVAEGDHGDGDVPIGALFLLAAGYVPLIWRRRHPVATWLACGIATAIYGLTAYEDPPLHFAGLVALYSVALYTSRATTLKAALGTAAVMLVVLVTDQRADVADWALAFISAGTALLLGDTVRTHAEQRERAAAQAVAAERMRIARELHDVAAHHVGVIAVQAEAGQALLPGDPATASRVLDDIANAARSALAEMRRVLEVLRQDDGAALGPQPSLDDLAVLVERVEGAGLDVDLTVEGERRPVPAGIDLSAYRIVQEALTNSLRHAGPCRVDVRVRYRADAIELDIADDGRGQRDATERPGPGHGIAGMRERVASCGGTLEVGGGPNGGFAVHARLPL